jgi:hypothetical protein
VFGKKTPSVFSHHEKPGIRMLVDEPLGFLDNAFIVSTGKAFVGGND